MNKKKIKLKDLFVEDSKTEYIQLSLRHPFGINDEAAFWKEIEDQEIEIPDEDKIV